MYSDFKLIVGISPTTETKLISNLPNDEVFVEGYITISPKTSFESSGAIIFGLSPLKEVIIFPFIASSKVQVKPGLILKLIFIPIGHDIFWPFNFKLLIETILDTVVPWISEANDIPTFLPMTD